MCDQPCNKCLDRCDRPQTCACGLNTGDLQETLCSHLVCEDCKITCEVCGELVCPACVVKNDEGDELCGGECLTIIEAERKAVVQAI